MGRPIRAIIAGAGIGGLAAAIALREAGVEAVVVEQARELREVGAGLTLWPNAMQALRRLGLAEAVEARGMRVTSSRIRTRRGDVLVTLPADALARAGGAPFVAIHRADLQAVLRAALSADALRLDTACRAFSQDADGVRVRLGGREDARADLLIGADGIHSAIRAQLWGPAAPRYAGYTAWRGVAAGTPAGLRPGEAFEAWGCGRRFGAVGVGAGRVYWFAARNAPRGQPDGPLGRKRELWKDFRGWWAPVAALIASTPEPAILRNDIVDRPPLPRWSAGRVTLLGDAAHPMTPNLGQGAGQALEDAVVLAAYLADGADIPAALRAYEARRRPRANRILRQSRLVGWAAQWRSAPACRLRDGIARHVPPGVQRAQLATLVESGL